MKLIRLAVAALAMTATAMLTVAGAPAFAATQGPYEIQPQYYPYCVYTGSQAQSWPVTITGCGSASSFYQQWYFQDTTNGYYRIFNRQSGKCLNVQGNATTVGAHVIQYGCGTTSLNDQWRPRAWFIDPNGPDFYWLVNRRSGLCLLLPRATTGTQLIQGDCNDETGRDQWTWHAPPR